MGATALVAGYTADIIFGDPRRGHPVAGFGTVAGHLERAFYAPTRARGALLTGTLIGAAAGVGALVADLLPGAGGAAVVLWATLGGRTLCREAAAVEARLAAGDLPGARTRLRSLCGRDTGDLDATAIRAAVIESLAENTSDAVVGALVWAALTGPAGAGAYRAANTLDAMWGHHSDRYEQFGWAPARLDDLLNWVPARVTAALVCRFSAFPALPGVPALPGGRASCRAAVRRDAAAHPSPNAGVVEAAFAGALGVTLGGPLSYAGVLEARPRLGDGRAPEAADVTRALRLSARVGAAATVVCAGVATLFSALIATVPTSGITVRRRRR
nr:adenosylcobinamide-phosphate synthase CbiB [Conexibacter sp. DBS9H8]